MIEVPPTIAFSVLSKVIAFLLALIQPFLNFLKRKTEWSAHLAFLCLVAQISLIDFATRVVVQQRLEDLFLDYPLCSLWREWNLARPNLSTFLFGVCHVIFTFLVYLVHLILGFFIGP